MSPERLVQLRGPAFARHWHRMEEKRDRRATYCRTHGHVPTGWTPPAPGEQDRTRQVLAMQHYWHTRAKLKARLRKHPDAMSAKLMNAYLAAQRIRSRPRRAAALAVVESMLFDNVLGGSHELSFREFRDLQALRAFREDLLEKLSRGRKPFLRKPRNGDA